MQDVDFYDPAGPATREAAIAREAAVAEEANQKRRDAVEKLFSARHNWFRVGETITIDGIKFRIAAVKPKEIRLKLLPRSAQA
jgi:uncharacterized Zn finger protein